MSQVSGAVGYSYISARVSFGVGSSRACGVVVSDAEWHWLETYPGIGHEGDGVARPREAIEVAEFGLDRLEGEMKRPVEVLSDVA